ncbi:hypothetical protein IEJ02_05355 [Streptomyces sp. 5-10]|nr:hypothetical protein [Streptomyces sp. 5-10]
MTGNTGITGRCGPCLAGLSRARWITSREDTAGALSLARLCAAAGFEAAVAFRSNNYGVVRELVSAGLGVAIVPGLGHSPGGSAKATRPAQRSAYRRVMDDVRPRRYPLSPGTPPGPLPYPHRFRGPGVRHGTGVGRGAGAADDQGPAALRAVEVPPFERGAGLPARRRGGDRPRLAPPLPRAAPRRSAGQLSG